MAIEKSIEGILPEEQESYNRGRALVEGSNISQTTLLATDYLNHFNEIVMLFGIIPDVPECFEEILEWKPKSYKEHFRQSTVKDAALAIEVYDFVPQAYKKPFEDTVRQMDNFILICSRRVGAALKNGDEVKLHRLCAAATTKMNQIIAVIDTIIHGDVRTIDQAGIDEIMRED